MGSYWASRSLFLIVRLLLLFIYLSDVIFTLVLYEAIHYILKIELNRIMLFIENNHLTVEATLTSILI